MTPAPFPSPLGAPLDPAAIHAALGPLAAAFAVRVLPECASTNSELMEATPPADGRCHVLAAERQTAGRGRRGRSWQSWPGASLTFSTLWRFAPGAPVPAGLSLVAGLALVRALEQLGVVGLQLKWPNDVLIHGDKLAGILVELQSARGRGLAAVVGIGLNLRLPPDVAIPDQPGVTDLARHLPAAAADTARNTLLAHLLRELHATFQTYAAGGFATLRGAWEARNAFADLPVAIRDEGGPVIEGVCAGVDDDGALRVRTAAGLTRILSGEVSLRALA